MSPLSSSGQPWGRHLAPAASRVIARVAPENSRVRHGMDAILFFNPITSYDGVSTRTAADG
jgi:hypothetical protein